jgi:hypothetical protein
MNFENRQLHAQEHIESQLARMVGVFGAAAATADSLRAAVRGDGETIQALVGELLESIGELERVGELWFAGGDISELDFEHYVSAWEGALAFLPPLLDELSRAQAR